MSQTAFLAETFSGKTQRFHVSPSAEWVNPKMIDSQNGGWVDCKTFFVRVSKIFVTQAAAFGDRFPTFIRAY